MARFEMQMPEEIMSDIKYIHDNSEEIFGAMTKAGAEVAQKRAISNAPNPKLKSHIKVSRTYKTPSDDGINNKVYINGYIPFTPPRKSFIRNGYVTKKGIPADFIAKVYEYGRKGRPFPKRPFFRKSFNKSAIEAAMKSVQSSKSGGLLK